MKKSKDKPRRRRFTEAERQAIVTEYQTTSMSQKVLAAKHGISITTIQNWLRSYREAQVNDTDPKLIPVRITDSQTSIKSNRILQTGFKITLKSSRQLRFSSGFDPAEVRMLIKILEETC